MGERTIGTDVVLAVREAALQSLKRYPDLREDWDDIAGDVVADFLQTVTEQGIRSPEGWGATAASHKAIDLIRRRKAADGRPRQDPELEPGAQDGVRLRGQAEHNVPLDAWDENTVGAVRAFVARGLMTSREAMLAEQVRAVEGMLNARELELIRLVADGVPYEQIAQQMGYANANSVKSTVSSLRRRITAAAEEAGIDTEWEGHQRPY